MIRMQAIRRLLILIVIACSFLVHAASAWSQDAAEPPIEQISQTTQKLCSPNPELCIEALVPMAEPPAAPVSGQELCMQRGGCMPCVERGDCGSYRAMCEAIESYVPDTGGGSGGGISGPFAGTKSGGSLAETGGGPECETGPFPQFYRPSGGRKGYLASRPRRPHR